MTSLVKTSGIGNTVSDANGLLLINPTPAIATAQVQYSPPAAWEGTGYNSGAVASETVEYLAYVSVSPVALNHPTGNLIFQTSVNGAGWTQILALATSGNVGIGTTSPTSLLSVGSGSPFTVNASGQVVAAGVSIAGFSQGAVIFAGSAGALSASGVGTAGQALVSGGMSAPTWSLWNNGVLDITQFSVASNWDAQNIADTSGGNPNDWNANWVGFQSTAVADGYLYLVPFASGVMVRFNLAGNFHSNTAGDWTQLTLTNVHPDLLQPTGCVVQNDYLYIVPWGSANGTKRGTLARLDCRDPRGWNNSPYSAWRIVHVDQMLNDPAAVGYESAFSDGVRLYLIPRENNLGNTPPFVALDLRGDIGDPSSWSEMTGANSPQAMNYSFVTGIATEDGLGVLCPYIADDPMTPSLSGNLFYFATNPMPADNMETLSDRSRQLWRDSSGMIGAGTKQPALGLHRVGSGLRVAQISSPSTPNTAPQAPTVTPYPSGGGSAYSYACALYDAAGNSTLPSAFATGNTAPAYLNDNGLTANTPLTGAVMSVMAMSIQVNANAALYANFPNIASSTYFYISVNDGVHTAETMLVTAMSAPSGGNSTWTVQRGQLGTTPQGTINNGAQVTYLPSGNIVSLSNGLPDGAVSWDCLTSSTNKVSPWSTSSYPSCVGIALRDTGYLHSSTYSAPLRDNTGDAAVDGFLQTGGLGLNVQTVAGVTGVQLTRQNAIVFLDASSANAGVKLPTAAGNGMVLILIRTDNSSHTVSINGFSTQTIEGFGVSANNLRQISGGTDAFMVIVSNAANKWYIIASGGTIT